jgi:transposase
MAYIKSYRGQNWLLPPSLEEMIPEDHICYLVEELVDSLDFDSFDIKYSGAGHPTYHPRIILKILVIGFLDKIRSSRKLARNARENVVYIYLSEKLSPDFRTISDFRKCNPDLVKSTFKHTVTLAKLEGMLDLSVLNTDGTKLKANASNRKLLSKEEIEFISKFIDNELEEWTKQDKIEDDFFGKIRGSDQLPEKSKKKMKGAVERYIKELKEKGDISIIKDKIKEAKEELDKNDLDKVSLTDPECRFMKNKKGKIEFSYNPQITTDNNGIILSNDVCQDAVDTDQLKPQVLQTKENVGELPEKVKWNFDNSYLEGENLHFLDEENIDGHLSCQEKKNISDYDYEKFVYDEKKDEYLCPEGNKMIFLREQYDKSKEKFLKLYKGQSCKNCPKKGICTKRKDGVRYLNRLPYEKERRDMKEKMKTEEAKKIYDRRKETVEPRFGDIKENKGMLSFLTRNLKNVRTEFNLACIGSNLQRINNLRMNKALSLTT